MFCNLIQSKDDCFPFRTQIFALGEELQQTGSYNATVVEHTSHFSSACNTETSFHSCVLYMWRQVLLCTYSVLGFLAFPDTPSRLRMCDLVGVEIQSGSGESLYCSTEIISICMKFISRCGSAAGEGLWLIRAAVCLISSFTAKKFYLKTVLSQSPSSTANPPPVFPRKYQTISTPWRYETVIKEERENC